MAAFIASYDLMETNRSPHPEFLEQAEKNGWVAWILASDDKRYRLPNTTLVGDFPDKAAAVAVLKKTRADTEQELGIKVTMENGLWPFAVTAVLTAMIINQRSGDTE